MEAKDFVDQLIASGMTQSQIAERTGIPQPSISKVARGDVSDVMSKNYRKLQELHAEVCGAQPPPFPIVAKASAAEAGQPAFEDTAAGAN
jgi:transcriptional regulator with XRE-family HTH domain